MSVVVLLFCLSVILIGVNTHPTMYKYNENRVLEPDLVPVSSTVIPLPVYQVGYGFNIASKDAKGKKPEGPIYLITVNDRKKHIPVPKEKTKEVPVPINKQN